MWESVGGGGGGDGHKPTQPNLAYPHLCNEIGRVLESGLPDA